MWFLYLLSWIGLIVQLSFVILSVEQKDKKGIEWCMNEGLTSSAYECLDRFTHQMPTRWNNKIRELRKTAINILLTLMGFLSSNEGLYQLLEAAGLYYIAELIEEYTVLTCRIIRVLILITMAIYGGMFLFESFPASMIISGIISQVMHLLVLKTFPFFDLTSFPFIGSVGFVVINHYLAFKYFSTVYYPFSEVLTYFTLCLWLIPFSFFVSLSANENVLPTLSESRPLTADESDVVTNYFSRRSKRYGLLSFFNYAKESILPQRVKKVF